MTDFTKPNGYECSSCIQWDDINGCWNDCKKIGDKNCTGEFNSNDNYEVGK